MKRRSFLHGALAGTVSLVHAAAHSQMPTRAPQGIALDPRRFEPSEATIADLQLAMRTGAQTSTSITEGFLQRIALVDKQGPAINAIIELNQDALAIADTLDRERRETGPRGPLHGIPVLIKDNIDTADRLRTSAGSLALAESIALRDAFVVKRLRSAGCVLLGKTNMSEWANSRSLRSTSGWSGRGGQTKNPYALDRNPSGSSSGSAAAVAASLCAVAIGTETDGSIVSPASVCGIVGIKPTVGLVSRSGIIPLSRSQDTAGPMTRCVADAATLLGAMAGIDARDRATFTSQGRAAVDYTQFLDAAGLDGARIGIARELFGGDERYDRVIDSAITEMRRAGAIVIDPVRMATPGQLDQAEFELILRYEFKAGLNEYFAGLGPGARVRTLDELIVFNERNAAREMPYFGQELLLKAQLQRPLTDAAYARALARNQRLARARGIDAALAKDRLDAIVSRTAGPAWITDFVTGDHETQIASQPAAVAGYPHVTVPAGFVFGLPIGISFFASGYSEPTLIRLAYAFEQRTKARKPPQYLPTAALP